MAGRRVKPEVNRRNYHAARVASAATLKDRLWALCHWLVAEAWRTGQLEPTIRLLEDHIESLIAAGKEVSADDNGRHRQ